VSVLICFFFHVCLFIFRVRLFSWLVTSLGKLVCLFCFAVENFQ